MVCRNEAPRPVCGILQRREDQAATPGILFLRAWQLLAVQKACQSPRRGPGTPLRLLGSHSPPGTLA